MYVCVRMYECMYVCIYVCTYVWASPGLEIDYCEHESCLCMYVCVCVRTYVRIYVYVYIALHRLDWK